MNNREPHSLHAWTQYFTASRFLLLRLSALFLLFCSARPAVPYSMQSHEELIDLSWKQAIRPLLLRHFPTLTEAQLLEAHAYAYGGSAIQDFGYYPFGNAFFSDLTHYVRSGDFVVALIRNSKNANDLAFAIGSLSHYVGDAIGHAEAVNESVSLEFPKLRKRYGKSVNYAEDPHAHVQTELAFDINQLSKGHFAPSGYLHHIGLEVPIGLLRLAFYQTYGLNLPDIVGKRDRALRVYRFAARRFLPGIANAETILHKHNFPAEVPSPDLDSIIKDLAQASADNDWEAYRKAPGFSSHLFAAFIFILPKVGTLKLLAIKGPTDQTEALYIRSLNKSITGLRLILNNFAHVADYVPNQDLDTGERIRPGRYRLSDDTYAKLLKIVTTHPANPIPQSLKHDIIAYYADPAAPIITKNDPKKWALVQANLVIIQTMPTSNEPPPIGNTIDIPSLPRQRAGF